LAPGDTGLFAGAFRSAVEGGLADVYGDDARFLEPKGMAGYASAKPMVPAYMPHHVVTHRVMGPDGPRPRRRAERMRILHFEGLTPTHWAVKQLRYAVQSERRILMRPARYAALREIIAAQDVKAAALERFGRTYRLPVDALATLSARGALHSVPFDIEGIVARHAPQVEFDATGARLNRALAPRLDELAAEVAARRGALLAVPAPG
jgi:hypothetical protein